MSCVTSLACVACGVEFPVAGESAAPVRGASAARVSGESAATCSACGVDDGILDVRFDLDRVRRTLTREALATRPASIWRYRELLPLDPQQCPPTPALDDPQYPPTPALADIGWTPLIEAPRLAKLLGVRRLRLKDDGRSASGSFKDRASAIGVAHAMQRGFREIACASTGNAASSLAHCAAAAGLRANIFVSQRIPEGKLAQLLAYGARVFKVRGSYADAYALCMQACEKYGWYNRNCAINPYLVEGKKTGGLEVAEQCADDPPDWVVCSVGDGCSIAGVWKGLAQMHAVGVISWQTRMLGVQAAGVAPIAEMWDRIAIGQSKDVWHRHPAGDSDATPAEEKPQPGAAVPHSSQPGAAVPHPKVWHRHPAGDSGDTYADSINVPVPRNWRKALNAVIDSNGAYVTVRDQQIMESVRDTGRLTGVFAEPAAATAIAGIAEARWRGVIDSQASVVAMITGNGLKDIAGALRAVGEPIEVEPDFAAVERVVADRK